MNNRFQTKLRLVYFPFLLHGIGIIVVYTFFHWLLFYRYHPFLLKEEGTNMWIPVFLPWIPLLIWYRPRLKLLKFKNATLDPATAMVMLAWLAMVAPLIITQLYLSTAIGKLTSLNNVREIAQAKETRYYTFKDYFVDKGYTGAYLVRKTSGKYNQDLDVSLYIVCPLYDKDETPEADSSHYPISDTGRLYFLDGSLSDLMAITRLHAKDIASVTVLKGAAALSRYGLAGKNGVILVNSKNPGAAMNPAESLPDSIKTASPDEGPTKIGTINQDTSIYPLAWIGVKYTVHMSNRLDKDVKMQRIKDFENESWLVYVQRPMKGFTYFDEIPYSDNYSGYQKAVNTTERVRPDGHLRVLEPKNNPFENRNGSRLLWIFGSFAIGAVVYWLILMLIPLDEEKVNAWLVEHPGQGE